MLTQIFTITKQETHENNDEKDEELHQNDCTNSSTD